jgi:hypothetical protein
MGADLELIKCTWPELGLSARFEPIADNRELFDWFRSVCPTSAMQSHAVVSGKIAYVFNLPVSKPYPGNWSEVKRHNLMDIPLGYGGAFATFGRVAAFCLKYGPVSEPMYYPYFCQALPEDLGFVISAGHQIWDAIYNTKKLIRVEFTAA